MGTAYFFLAQNRVMVTAYWGRTEPSENVAVREARVNDPARAGAVGHVIDLSAWERTNTTPQTESASFRTLGETYVDTYGTLPTAIIAQRPHVFGQARVFETLASLRAPELRIRVVKSWEEAAEFLGLDLQEAEAEVRRRKG